MLTSSEKHFIQSWKEQRDGPKWKYYLQYTIAWSVVIFLGSFLMVKLVMEDRYMSWSIFFIILPSSILLAFLSTHLIYFFSEKRYQRILQREKEVNN